MKPYARNPRRISDKQLADLSTWLAELGDLSGIVHDLNSDEIVGGNQRSKVFAINECEIVPTEEYSNPDEQGTVALGYIVWQGNKYAYRQVRWTERQAEQANIVANRAGGEWDFELLSSNFAVDDLLAWGFEPVELGQYGEGNDPNAEWVGMPEFEQEDLTAFRSIHVHFKTQEDVDTFAELIGQKIGENARSLWYPEAEKIDMYSELWVNES